MIGWLRKKSGPGVRADEGAKPDVEATSLLPADFKALQICCIDLTDDGVILGCVDGAGLVAADFHPETLDDLVQHAEGLAALVVAIRSLLSGAEQSSAFRPVKVTCAEGETLRWVEVVPAGSFATAEGGRARRLFLRDVTAEQMAQASTEKRLALMNRALDRAPFGLVVLDQRGTVRDTNTAFRRLVEGRPLGGKELIHVFHQDDRPTFERLMSVLTREGEVPSIGPMDLRLDVEGDERIVTVYGNRTHVVQLDEPGVLLHAIDATERKRLETQFAQSQKMQAVGQLAGGIAHDFNNVLTAIIGFCDLLLQRHQPGDPSFADVMQIQQNANRAAGLTRQLLAFSRQQTIRSRLFDVTDTVAELSNLLRRLLGESVELSMLHGQDLWTVRGDRGQLEQIIINLAVNARDAMEKGGRLVIQTDNFSSDRPYQMRDTVMPAGEYVTITVADTGMGMTAEILSRIFEPFFTTKEVGRGTGLGLAMVYGSVTQMGGHIVAHSDGPGKGASFSLYLPRAIETEKDRLHGAEGAHGARDGAASDDTGGETILLVEDEDAVRLFSARALRSKGYTVTEARTGEIALGILADQSFDLLITDMVMPKVDGATLIRKAREAAPDLPVICISGYTRESVAKEVAELPGISFLSKPFSLKQLTGRVRSVLGD